MSERWRDIIGTPYMVSTEGRVARVLKRNLSTHGYRRVALCMSAVKRDYDVHRLVAAAWIGPAPSKHDVNHKDGDRTNNRLSNLEYVTRSGNMIHAVRTGLLRRSSLTVEAVREIRRTGHAVPWRFWAKKFKISRTSVYDILNHRSWKHASQKRKGESK